MLSEEILELESFRKLARRRSRMVKRLSSAIILLFAGNIYLMSIGAEIGSRVIFDGSVITVALAYSIFIVFAGAVLALFYVWWANTRLDDLIDSVHREVGQGDSNA